MNLVLESRPTPAPPDRLPLRFASGTLRSRRGHAAALCECSSHYGLVTLPESPAGEAIRRRYFQQPCLCRQLSLILGLMKWMP
jgi:hypothetical protein